MPMPGRTLTGSENYRYAYQGQEGASVKKCPVGIFSEAASLSRGQETGKEAFQLRLWDGRIGRWLSPDPYGQYFSPYLGMGNNPISRIDPDGGSDGPGDPPDDVVQLPEVFLGTVGGGHSITSNGFDWSMLDNFPGLTFTNDLSQVNVKRVSDIKLNTQERIDWYRNLPQWQQVEFNKYSVTGAMDDVAEKYIAPVMMTLLIPGGGIVGGAGEAVLVQSTRALTTRAVTNTTMSRVFWSGGAKAMDAATKFAETNGMTTIGMTRAGQNLTNLTKGLHWETIARPMWDRLSAQYARGASGTVHVFQNANGVGINSIWGTTEYGILQQNNVKIIYHIVF